MPPKDLIALIVSVLALAVSALNYRLTRKTKSNADAIEVVSRKNEIVNEYQSLLIRNAEYRFQIGRLAAMLSRLGPGDDPAGYADATRRVRESLEMANQTDRITNASIDRVRTFDPAEVVANPKAREALEELYGKAQQAKIKLDGNVEDIKRWLKELGGDDPLPET